MTAALVMLLAAAAPERLAAGGFAAVSIEPAKAQFFSDYFADQLNSLGTVRVITQAEMAALLGAERQRQLMGCGDTSCVAELAGALDAAGVIIGSVAKVGDEYAVQVKIVGSTGALMGLYSTRVKKEPEVLDFLAQSALNLADKLHPAATSGTSRSKLWIIPAVGGAVLGGLGVVLRLLAQGVADQMTMGTGHYAMYADLQAARANGELMQGVAVGMWVVGGVALAAAVVMAVLNVGGGSP